MTDDRTSRATVIWLIQAQDDWQNALGGADLSAAEIVALRLELEDLLRQTFSDARAIVIVERLSGYSRKAKQHVLRVEVKPDSDAETALFPRTMARVVKTGPLSRIEQEWNGWLACQRPSNDRGRALMTLTRGFCPSTDSTARLLDLPVPCQAVPLEESPNAMSILPTLPASKSTKSSEPMASLVYEDAQQTLHAAEIVSLERAVLNCCRWGVPSVASVLGVLDQIFAELIDRFYRRSWTVAAGDDEQRWWRSRLKPGYDAWRQLDSLACGCRRFVQDRLAKFPGDFRDLESFYKKDLNFVPSFLRGPAHGDLHGRNILIGLVDGEARWPAVFDYEDMTANNALVWDFVKLEMELKIRALQVVFPVEGIVLFDPTLSEQEKTSSPQVRTRSFPEMVAEFEQQLCVRTEKLNNGMFDEWRVTVDAETPQARLMALLLGLRRQAKKCLEVETGHGRRWLHEYYFGLAAYGTYCGRFHTYTALDFQAAYTTAGIAAGRFLWAVNRIRFSPGEATEQARHALNMNAPHERLTGPEHLGHEPRFAFASVFIRSHRREFVEPGIQLLDELRQEFPQVPEIWQEQVLGLLEISRIETDRDQRLNYQNQAYGLLKDFDRQTRGLFSLDVELNCRFGRHWKDCGDFAIEESLHTAQPVETAFGAAASCYEQALRYYQRASRIEPRNYYPAINVATLQFLLGMSREAHLTASQIIRDWSGTTFPTDDPHNDHWIYASLGEAALVLKQFAEAKNWYGLAVQHPACDPHARSTMWRQVQHILSMLHASDSDWKILLNGDTL